MLLCCTRWHITSMSVFYYWNFIEILWFLCYFLCFGYGDSLYRVQCCVALDSTILIQERLVVAFSWKLTSLGKKNIFKID